MLAQGAKVCSGHTARPRSVLVARPETHYFYFDILLFYQVGCSRTKIVNRKKMAPLSQEKYQQAQAINPLEEKATEQPPLSSPPPSVQCNHSIHTQSPHSMHHSPFA
jgi:hypothetical protein